MADMSRCNKIRHIVRIQQMLKRWRKKARVTASSRSGTAPPQPPPTDVPAGHVAVIVGASCRRFIVRATYLNHPVFKSLLIQAEEEYGFRNAGPLTIPCEESDFEEVLRVVSRSESGRFGNIEDVPRCCHVGVASRNLDLLGESWPLLRGS